MTPQEKQAARDKIAALRMRSEREERRWVMAATTITSPPWARL